MIHAIRHGRCEWLILLGALGCGGRSPPAPPTPPQAVAEPEDHHHGPGPHGGTIADWGGGDYHVEFAVDHDRREAAVYILGSDAKTLAPVRAERLLLVIDEPAFEVDLLPLPMEGEAEGWSSRFVGRHDQLGLARGFSGTIVGRVDGVPYAGQFAEQADDHAYPH